MKVMMMIKLFVTAIAVTVALTIAISTTKNLDVVVEGKTGDTAATAAVVAPSSKRVSRFLAEEKNPRAADHCKRDNEICYALEGKNSTCCNNKCMDLAYDKHNCGACKNKCKFTSTCCRGECVNLSFDKRHCGGCGNRCMTGGYCFYGMCDYA